MCSSDLKRTRFLDGIAPDTEPARAPARRDRPVRCRVCGNPLDTPQDKALGRHVDCPSGADEQIFATLRTWRSDLAREANVPAYIIFSDATLTAIAETLPRDERELLAAPGVGPVKVERYGAGLLAVLAEFR